MLSFEEILESVVAGDPSISRERLRKVYDYAKDFYGLKISLDGRPYMEHALEVAEVLVSFHPDEKTIIATILHGFPQDSRYKESEIAKLFGEDVADLVTSIGILSLMKMVNKNSDLDSLRRMFLVVAKDLRVIMIRLADRLSAMRRLKDFPVNKQKPLARETLDIYVPIASRLGIYNIKVQLEDLCFQYLFPKQYELLGAQLDEYKKNRGNDISSIVSELKTYLAEHGIEAEVEGRIKNLYSIYKKLKLRSHTTLDDIFDIFATRIILPTKLNEVGKEQSGHLYGVIGLIHNKWTPIANRFKDYIAVPKANGYQSLHTAVLGLSPSSRQPTEIQIRSQRMHEEAEYGIASHWLYEDLKKMMNTIKNDSFESVIKGQQEGSVGKYLVWLDVLSKLQKDVQSGSEFMEALKLDVFNDRIFVLTPSGDVRDLPKDGTPVDFAYSVHTDIGHRCILAKVNGSVVPLDYKLKNGEVVEITCGNKINPKLSWLSFVKSAGARAKIKAYFRGLDKDRSFREGKDFINKFLGKMGKPLLDDDLSIFREYGGDKLSFKDRVGIIESVGSGLVLVAPVLRKVFGKAWKVAEVDVNAQKDFGNDVVTSGQGVPAEYSNIVIAGETKVPHRIAQCCNPVPGNLIVGYVTRGNAVTIHRRGCKVFLGADQVWKRILAASWGSADNFNKMPVKGSLKKKDKGKSALVVDNAGVVDKSEHVG
jgi:guanosine-3',5'-bis(diphosphate) 3'-pyrophosphohydrolase